MKIGDKVTWTSNGRGNITFTKIGTIVARVPPNYDVNRIALKPHLSHLHCQFRGTTRSTSSYLVEVLGPKRNYLYWPKVIKLKEIF
jgi:hypothetical protein